MLPKGDRVIYDGSLTVKIGKRIAPDDLSFGTTYKERQKKITAFYKADFGIYYQDREKTNTRRFASGCEIYCGYTFDFPDELLSVFTAENTEVKDWILENTELKLESEVSFDGIKQRADGMYMAVFKL